MDLQSIILRMCVLFILMAIGFIANKTGYMNATFNKQLSAFIVNVAIPGMILYSVMGDERLLTNAEVFILLGISIGSFVVIILLSHLVPRILHIDGERYQLTRFITIFSNVAFMGYPVISAVFGANAVFYAAVFNIPFNFLVYSYGIKLVSNGKHGGINLRTLLTPCSISSVLSVIIYLIHIPIPQIIQLPLSYMGDMTVPAAMTIIGSSLAMAPIREIFRGAKIYLISAIKLILIPLFVYVCMYFLPVADIIKQVTVVMWSLPVATNATMLAIQYEGDEFLASKGVFVTTLLSVITIPCLLCILFIR